MNLDEWKWNVLKEGWVLMQATITAKTWFACNSDGQIVGHYFFKSNNTEHWVLTYRDGTVRDSKE